MSQLEKAKLQEVRVDKKETPIGQPVEVQFNPTSLKLKISNSVEGGQSKGRQRRQQNAKTSTVLTLELIFDSADEEKNGAAVSVRKKTAIIEKYLLAKKDGTETPPKLRFQWNEFIVTGIVESVDIDFDLFAPDGTPLRAKASLSIKEQDSKYMLLKEGAGAKNSDQSEKTGGGRKTRPGAKPGGGNGNRSATALEGETAPEFAARQGLDPAAWRGLDVDLSTGLSLDTGVEIGFSASLSAGAGIGFSAGIQAGLDLSLEADVGLESRLNTSAAGSVSSGFSGDESTGFALSAAGGVEAAIETVNIAKSQAATEAAVRAFSAPSGSASSALQAVQRISTTPNARNKARAAAAHAVVEGRFFARPKQVRTPLVATGLPNHSQQQEAPDRLPAPKADRRSVGYGFGVPLRGTYATAFENEQVAVCSTGRLAAMGERAPIVRKDPTTAPWIELPRRDPMRTIADATQARNRAHPCGFLYGVRRNKGKP